MDNRVATSRANFNRDSPSFARSHILIIREHELRRDLALDMLVDVEILDVTEEEARKLLLTIDPLAVEAHWLEAPGKMVRRISSKSEKA